MNVEVNWQDADLSSAKGFRYSYNNEQQSKIMLCGGHVGWAHGKKVQELQNMTSFSSDFFNLYKGDFPNLTSVKYCCARKKHVFVAMRNKLVCGCIRLWVYPKCQAKLLLSFQLVHAGKDPEKYRETMLTLGRYHCRYIHQ